MRYELEAPRLWDSFASVTVGPDQNIISIQSQSSKARQTQTSGYSNVIHELLLKRILFPPPHIKLGQGEPVTNALHHNKPRFQYFKVTFRKIRYFNIKGHIFVGPQVRKLIDDVDFHSTMD